MSTFTDFSHSDVEVQSPIIPCNTRIGRKKQSGSGKRLAPLQYLATSYDIGTASSNNKPKKILHKKDLADAVRRLALSPCVSLTTSRGEKKRPIDLPDVDDSSSKELESLEDGVNLNVRKYNELKMLVDRRQKDFNSCLDELKALTIENDALREMTNKCTAGSLLIQDLQAKIDMTLKSMEDKVYHRRQLDHMASRLQSNQINFESHIKAMEDTLEASIKEYEEVKILVRLLEAGKNGALQQLHLCQQHLQLERRLRERDINEKKSEARNAQKMEEWRLERIRQRAELAAELRGDMSKDEESRLKNDLRDRSNLSETLKKENNQRSIEATNLELSFMQMRQATGANSLQEMVEKFVSQSANKASLVQEQTDAENRLKQAKNDKEQAIREFSDLKAYGKGGLELNRESYERLDAEIVEKRTTLKANKTACDRLDTVLLAIRQGAFGLLERLNESTDILYPLDSVCNAQVGTSGSETLDALQMVEMKLVKILEVIGLQQGHANSFDNSRCFEAGEQTEGSRMVHEEENNCTTWSPLKNNDAVLRKNNVRVLSNTEGTQELEDQPLQKIEDNSSFVEESMDDSVPSRHFLKMNSNRQYAETLRKRETAEKKHLAMERGLSENITTSKARRKQQSEASKRLSASPKSISKLGLPKGVTMKDDIMTRSNALLTQIPELS